eukprot:TRINITY_DN4878_c0_g2_i1.p1 TRINITY_DN4878_c0_g2~~TRINITY_DN4878_c0_g2_i1.p1  ORF type:complete len:123 (+),score=3.29 TRINITY_DN4878_c0_g2_i1:861-1229(+)
MTTYNPEEICKHSKSSLFQLPRQRRKCLQQICCQAENPEGQSSRLRRRLWDVSRVHNCNGPILLFASVEAATATERKGASIHFTVPRHARCVGVSAADIIDDERQVSWNRCKDTGKMCSHFL